MTPVPPETLEQERDRLRRERDEARHEWAWQVEDEYNCGEHGSAENYVAHILRRRFGIDEDEARKVARMQIDTPDPIDVEQP